MKKQDTHDCFREIKPLGGGKECFKLFFISNRDKEEGKHYAKKKRMELLEDKDKRPEGTHSLLD